MQVRDMSTDECLHFLQRVNFGRLACSHEGQPYVTPAFFAFEENCLYSFATVGQKIEWMRLNPQVCVAFDEITSPQNWMTVVVMGRFEEFPASAPYQADRLRAHELLQERRPLWWEPAYVKTRIGDADLAHEGVYFRIGIEQMSGRRGLPDS